MKKLLKNDDIPADWTLIDSLWETRTIADCTLYLSGYACQRLRDEKIVTGSWAGWEESSLDKARLELHERMALIEAMDHSADRIWSLQPLTRGEKLGYTHSGLLFPASPHPETMQFAKSNGVALGANFSDAAERAACEVVERHMVLGSWYGATRPRLCEMKLPTALQSLQTLYRFKHYDFGTFSLKGLGTVSVRGTFLWPLHADHPVIYGFGAAFQETDALSKSLSEAVQRLAFLDPLEVSAAEPAFSPTPDFHQDYFLHPARRPLLEAWLAGAASHPSDQGSICRSGEAHGIDLTPTRPCPGAVVRVMIPGTLPLVFGTYQPPSFPDLPERFWIHPMV